MYFYLWSFFEYGENMLKKIVSIFSSLLVLSFLTFILTRLSSTDPAENYLRISKIVITPAALENARVYLGLDKPFAVQYLDWLIGVLKGNFGVSYLQKIPVFPLVIENFWTTFQLGLVAFLLVLIVSLPLGILCGIYNGTWFDRSIRLITFISVSTPNFWLGYMLIVIFGVHLRWLPVSGKSEWTSIVLPSITLSYSLIGQYIALTRKAIMEQLSSVYVDNARMRGVKERYIIWHHLIPNALPSIATGISLTFVYLMTGSLIVEEVFSWNGLGSLFVKSLQAVDVPVIQCCMLLFGTLFLINNVIIEQLTERIDPRIRLGR